MESDPGSDGNPDPISGDEAAPDLNLVESCSKEPAVDPDEPYAGREFDSEAEAVAFYTAYAQRNGFGVRIRDHTRGREGFVVARTIVCNKEGYRKKKNENKKLKTGTSAAAPAAPAAPLRMGCNAKAAFKRLQSGKWAIKRFIKEHNHPLYVQPMFSCPRVLQIPADDRRIHQLTEELAVERRRSASLGEMVQMLLNHIEEHAQGLSQKVEFMVQKVNKIDDSRQKQQ
ncbi:Protein FAR1-RELATED SEQUENCE 5 [Linum grandiflorum]